MDGPQLNKENVVYVNVNEITLDDLLIMKQIIEKGFRKNLYEGDEQTYVNVVYAKIANILKKNNM